MTTDLIRLLFFTVPLSHLSYQMPSYISIIKHDGMVFCFNPLDSNKYISVMVQGHQKCSLQDQLFENVFEFPAMGRTF